MRVFLFWDIDINKPGAICNPLCPLLFEDSWLEFSHGQLLPRFSVISGTDKEVREKARRKWKFLGIKKCFGIRYMGFDNSQLCISFKR